MNKKEIFKLIKKEKKRQHNTIELIASENFVSKDILKAQGSILTNKYAEGYPTRRYYGGCEFIDEIEQIAIDEAKKLFYADHANVQPHSGSQANFAAYSALINPGDKVLAMSLSEGGHLTHGHHMNFSGNLYDFIHYGVDKNTDLIDYSKIRELALEHKPKLIVAGASAYSRNIDWQKISMVAKEVGAYFMVDMAHIAGLVAAGLMSNPVDYADVVTSTTHKTLRGPRGGLILCKKEHAKAIDRAVFPGAQGGPLEHIIAAKAICFIEAGTPQFKSYITQVMKNTKALAEGLEPLRVVAGGTDNHLLLVDVTTYDSELTGKKVEELLDYIGITCNKNTIPYDKKKPFITSGIRLGSAAMTSRGFNEKDFREIGNIIREVIVFNDQPKIINKLRKRVKLLMLKKKIRFDKFYKL